MPVRRQPVGQTNGDGAARELGQAAVPLGVDEKANEAEARKPCLLRARIMHRDRCVDGTDADRAAATRAMAQSC